MFDRPVWKRFIRFVSEDGRELGGEPADPDIDVGLSLAASKSVLVKVLDSCSALGPSQFTGETTIIKKLLSPLSASEVGAFRCVGLNFKDHAAELKVPIPKIPEVFMKPAGCLNNPLDPIQLPACAPDAVDAEVELAVIIGQDCKNVNAESALEYVLGYTIANDITARDMQSHTSQWVYCKGYDSFCPLGPVVVSACSVPDPSVLSMRTTLDGEVLQDSNTSQMIFSIAEIVSHLSKDTTLPKGTVILTGTPSGLGHGHIPPRYLRPGSMVYCYIGSGLGTLVNSVELRRS